MDAASRTIVKRRLKIKSERVLRTCEAPASGMHTPSVMALQNSITGARGNP